MGVRRDGRGHMQKQKAHGRSLEAIGFEVIKQYPGQEQVELKVQIEIPGR